MEILTRKSKERVKQMYQEMHNVIKTIVNQYGDCILLEPSRMHAIAADLLQNRYPDVLKCIGLAIFNKIPEEFYSLKSSDDHQRKTRMNILLSSHLGFCYKEKAYQIINMFADACRQVIILCKTTFFYNFLLLI